MIRVEPPHVAYLYGICTHLNGIPKTMPSNDYSRINNFGAARLILAGLVIFSHSPELLDGNRSREPLSNLFGTLSLGELAVQGFFIISGYLVTKSFTASVSAAEFLLKRVFRIFPGFLVAYFVSLFIVGFLAGGLNATEFEPFPLVKHLIRAFILSQPYLVGAFTGTHYPLLNGSMWTIQYEFCCYLLVLGAGIAGVLAVPKRPRVFVAVICLIALVVYSNIFIENFASINNSLAWLDGTLRNMRLFMAFFSGALFFVFQSFIKYTSRGALIATFLLFVGMSSHWLAEVTSITAGSYLIFYFVFMVKSQRLQSIGGNVDISYGLYLYAWPVQKLAILYGGAMAPWLLNTIALLGAGCLGYLSWRWIESPFLRRASH